MDESTSIVPFEVTEDDYWLSIPIEGITPLLIRLAFQQNTPLVMYENGVKAIMETAKREQGKRCKTCQRRIVSRIFFIFRPRHDNRQTGFAVCETCADRMKRGVKNP